MACHYWLESENAEAETKYGRKNKQRRYTFEDLCQITFVIHYLFIYLFSFENNSLKLPYNDDGNGVANDDNDDDDKY